MSSGGDEIISQKKFLHNLRTVDFHLNCLADSQKAAQKDAMEQYCGIGLLDDKIEAYRKLVNLDEIVNKTELAIEECAMLDLASQYVSQMQLEALRLGMLSKRLNEENDWLAKENKLLKARIQQLQKKMTTADADMQQYLLMCQIRQTDTFKTETKLIGASIERNLEINRNIMLFLSSHLKAFYPLALQYINSNRYEVAVSLCNQSRLGRKLSPPDEAVITYILALAALRQRETSEAVKLFEEALKLMSSSQGKNNICLVPLLVGYGKALRLAKKYKDSITQLQAAIALKQAVKEDDDEESWGIKVDIASDMLKMKMAKEAAQLLFDTLHRATRKLSPYENVVVLIKNYLARCYIATGQTKEALEMITGILEEIFEHDGSPSIPSVLKSPEGFEVAHGTDLITVCQQTNNMLELFTCQTLIMIYLNLKNTTAAGILSEYVRIHSVDYEIM